MRFDPSDSFFPGAGVPRAAGNAPAPAIAHRARAAAKLTELSALPVMGAR